MKHSPRHRLIIVVLAVFGFIGCIAMLLSAVGDQVVWDWHAPLLALAVGLWLHPKSARWIAMVYLSFLFFWVAAVALFVGLSASGTGTGISEFAKLVLYGALLGFTFSEVKDWNVGGRRKERAEPGATDNPDSAGFQSEKSSSV